MTPVHRTEKFFRRSSTMKGCFERALGNYGKELPRRRMVKPTSCKQSSGLRRQGQGRQRPLSRPRDAKDRGGERPGRGRGTRVKAERSGT